MEVTRESSQYYLAPPSRIGESAKCARGFEDSKCRGKVAAIATKRAKLSNRSSDEGMITGKKRKSPPSSAVTSALHRGAVIARELISSSAFPSWRHQFVVLHRGRGAPENGDASPSSRHPITNGGII